MFGGKNMIKQAKAEGKLYGNRAGFLLSEVYGHNRVWILGPHYPLSLDQHGWQLEHVTTGEIDLRKQAWSMHSLLKEKVPGFENSYIEKTPAIPLLRDTHRILGEYVLKEEDLLNGRVFEDSVAISNMSLYRSRSPVARESRRGLLMTDFAKRPHPFCQSNRERCQSS